VKCLGPIDLLDPDTQRALRSKGRSAFFDGFRLGYSNFSAQTIIQILVRDIFQNMRMIEKPANLFLCLYTSDAATG
jgi:hypothetical protein